MSKDEIKQAVCRAVEKIPHPEKITRVRLFGSHLHEDARPDSDVDLIIDIADDVSMGLFEFFDVEETLSDTLQKKVDLVTPEGLSKYIRDKVLREAETLYER